MKTIWFIVLLCTSFTIAQIKFDANFESGNMNTVTTNDSINFTITTNSDIGGRWFYFRISGVQNKYISVSIPTSDVNRPMYSYDDVEYHRFTESEAPKYNYFAKTFDKDTVFVAYYTPYTYSHLQTRINEWRTNGYVVSVDTLGFTQMGLPLQELVITDPFVTDISKEHIWIHARTHPGETPSSFQFDGIMQELLSGNEVINGFLKKAVFHMIPFVNPDGVFYGRSRTNYNGIDVEREWEQDSSLTCLEAQALRARMWEVNNEKVLSVFLNLHSQASSYCTFWIHTPGSTSDYFYQKEYQFSNLNISDNDYFFKEDFRESNLRRYFPEGHLWHYYGDKVMALTYETPYDQYSNDKWVTNENLYQIGKRTLYATMEYLEINHPKHFIMDNKNAELNNNDYNVNTSGLEFYSDDFYLLPVGNKTVTAIFESDALKEGNYDVYSWWPNHSNYTAATELELTYGGQTEKFNRTQRQNGGKWNFLANINIQQNETLKIEFHNSAFGLTAVDAFRVIYRGPVLNIEKFITEKSFILNQNYPNPFNPTTNISFTLKESANVKLTIFNSLGQQIVEILNDELQAGTYTQTFNAGKYRLSSGVYYYNLTTPHYSETKGMILVK